MPPTSDTRLVAGCMTGTSLDGLDAALVAITGHGLDMRANFIGMISRPLDDLRDELRHFASGGAAEPIRYMRAARRLGELHAEAVAALCEQEGCKQLDFVVAHGQTIWHAPGDRGKNPPAKPGAEGKMDAGVSWQLFDPWPIVRRLKIPVCYDLRQADLIAGGQGAPITPLSDHIMYPHGWAVVNLGGICNVTDLCTDKIEDITGYDIGPCNILIDGVVQRLFPPLRFDNEGALASQGQPHKSFSALMAKNPFFATPFPPNRSTGREDFSEPWISGVVDRALEQMSPNDIVASAVEFVAARIGDLTQTTDLYQLILAGGGARNPALVNRIRHHCDHMKSGDILLSDDLGIPCEAREAMGFAVLGALSQDGVPITQPRVTGANYPGRAGAWVYP